MSPSDDWCACGEDLVTPYEQRIGKCYECEDMDRRLHCCVCEKWVGMAYTDGSPTFCSDECEDFYYEADL